MARIVTAEGDDPVDFIRLAIREARRNASRTLFAVLAVALAAAAPIMARTIPEGYVKEFRMGERQYIGGDLVVCTAPAPIDARSQTPLSWRPWEGSDWQSHIQYFLPGLESGGYLAETSAARWRPLTAASVSAILSDVPGVADVRPYLTLSCTVETFDGPMPAILRGRDPEPAGSPHSMADLVTIGRPLLPEDRGTQAALVPNHGGTVPGAFAVDTGFTVRVGRASVTLKPVGGYQVVVGEVLDPIQQDRDLHQRTAPMLPVFWERPEIVVTQETFRRIASEAGGAPIHDLSSYPVYELSLKSARVSTLESTVTAVRKALGPDFAVFSVPELAGIKDSSIVTPVLYRDLRPAFLALIFSLAGVVTTGSVYILLSQQRRKIGLLRVVGATRKDIVVYALSVSFYVALVGDAAGFLVGKVFSLLALISTDMTLAEWLRLAGTDLLTTLGLSLSATGVLGLAVGIWASRIPCAEVLRRE